MSDNSQFDSKPTLVNRQSSAGRLGEFKAGDIVGGHYRIKAVIGRGGMGVVYLAEHRVIDRDIALKALAPDLVNESNWRRFQAEGKAIARLDHRNIVKVYDMGTDGSNCLYYVMDLLQGMSLAQYIAKQGPPALDEILAIFGQLCSGLGYAHRQGIVHRDVKPSNIILCSGGDRKEPMVKIIDFGLVKLVGEADQLVQSQTATGHVCGSPFYMSPEQCMAGQIDERSDIYSLGCTLFECLTGEPPFRGATGTETALMHLSNEPPKLRDVCPGKMYPESLEQLVGRMLQKTPAQRHQSMAQVAQDLLRIKAGKSVSREPIFADVPLFEIDVNAEEQLEAPDRKTGLPLAWICSLAAFVTLFTVWAVASHIFARDETQNATKDLIGPSANPDVITGRPDTPDIAHARETFANCPQISRGVVSKNGSPQRVFEFPDVALGNIIWGREGQYKQLAKGEVLVPADEPVTLQLGRPESEYTRMFPSVLAKIGPEDIYSLQVREPLRPEDLQHPENTSTLLFEVPLQLVKAIANWTALRKIEFHRCKVSDEVLLALNSLPALTDLKLKDGSADGSCLAKVKWLNALTLLDVKSIINVDAVLRVLAHAPSLRVLCLDLTTPSRDGLKALTTCKNLESLSLTDADIDDEKLAVICGISSLQQLDLEECSVTAKSVDNIAKLKRLRYLDLILVPMDQADIDILQRKLPRCTIKTKR